MASRYYAHAPPAYGAYYAHGPPAGSASSGFGAWHPQRPDFAGWPDHGGVRMAASSDCCQLGYCPLALAPPQPLPPAEWAGEVTARPAPNGSAESAWAKLRFAQRVADELGAEVSVRASAPIPTSTLLSSEEAATGHDRRVLRRIGALGAPPPGALRRQAGDGWSADRPSGFDFAEGAPPAPDRHRCRTAGGEAQSFHPAHFEPEWEARREDRRDPAPAKSENRTTRRANPAAAPGGEKQRANPVAEPEGQVRRLCPSPSGLREESDGASDCDAEDWGEFGDEAVNCAREEREQREPAQRQQAKAARAGRTLPARERPGPRSLPPTAQVPPERAARQKTPPTAPEAATPVAADPGEREIPGPEMRHRRYEPPPAEAAVRPKGDVLRQLEDGFGRLHEAVARGVAKVAGAASLIAPRPGADREAEKKGATLPTFDGKESAKTSRGLAQGRRPRNRASPEEVVAVVVGCERAGELDAPLGPGDDPRARGRAIQAFLREAGFAATVLVPGKAQPPTGGYAALALRWARDNVPGASVLVVKDSSVTQLDPALLGERVREGLAAAPDADVVYLGRWGDKCQQSEGLGGFGLRTTFGPQGFQAAVFRAEARDLAAGGGDVEAALASGGLAGVCFSPNLFDFDIGLATGNEDFARRNECLAVAAEEKSSATPGTVNLQTSYVWIAVIVFLVLLIGITAAVSRA